MALLDRIFGKTAPAPLPVRLWHQVVETARQPEWYAKGGIADTVPGRFDCICLVLSLVLIRMERDLAMRNAAARLTELFVSDMDGQLRQGGIGDLVMGKHMGRLVSALGGRLDAYRAGLAQPEDAALVEAIERNVTFAASADPAFVASAMRQLSARLAGLEDSALLAGAAWE